MANAATKTTKIPENILEAARRTVSGSGTTGGFVSPYTKQMGALTNKIVNREAFSYDPNTDQSYQALAQVYGRLGDRARQDTMADVASNTGGRMSSWAITAGQQEQNNYNQQLVGQIPALLDAAYSRYRGEFDMNNSALDQLRGLDDSAYGRFADNRDFTRGVFESDRGYNRDVFESDRGYNYGVSRDKVSDSQWAKEFGLESDQWNYQKKKDSVSSSKTSSTKKKTSTKKPTTKKTTTPTKTSTKTTTPFQSAIKSNWDIANYFAFNNK